MTLTHSPRPPFKLTVAEGILGGARGGGEDGVSSKAQSVYFWVCTPEEGRTAPPHTGASDVC